MSITLTHTMAHHLLDSLQALEHLALEGQVPQPSFGICYNLRTCLSNKHGIDYTESVYLICSIAASWKHSAYPGQVAPYPVPHNGTNAKWEGKNLELRLDLIRYAKRRLRDEMRRTMVEDTARLEITA